MQFPTPLYAHPALSPSPREVWWIIVGVSVGTVVVVSLLLLGGFCCFFKRCRRKDPAEGREFTLDDFDPPTAPIPGEHDCTTVADGSTSALPTPEVVLASTDQCAALPPSHPVGPEKSLSTPAVVLASPLQCAVSHPPVILADTQPPPEIVMAPPSPQPHCGLPPAHPPVILEALQPAPVVVLPLPPQEIVPPPLHLPVILDATVQVSAPVLVVRPDRAVAPDPASEFLTASRCAPHRPTHQLNTPPLQLLPQIL
ncbi:hypothetical protein PAPYR_10076 [Paratrimastix pyriformis]|uniref:Uncharacterized protein n=1 Tax=Paratrimastix pyriformis TaxID=342808 RepID=A0ABQ8UBP9_9EUKA|nr:hypothetical protein PAPYR_10076 [Paratrimastix pyriformis]